MSDQSDYFIGLMSGTSTDAVDAVLLAITKGIPKVISSLSQSIPENLKQKIHLLSFPGDDNLELFGNVDRELAILFADTVNQLLKKTAIDRSAITAIGSHGQTVRHQPTNLDDSKRFSLQVACPSTIAALTGITTVADFRRKDIALGGEAAPLVPAFHQAVFQHQTINRAIINIGGIANITWLPSAMSKTRVIGFDTGPGNCLMDSWISKNQNIPFDNKGDWAKHGDCQYPLLTRLLEHPYLTRHWPKSTGKEMFNLQWLETELNCFSNSCSTIDIQATLNRFTVESIVMGLKQLPDVVDEIFICGGGVYNNFLVDSLQQHYSKAEIKSTLDAGLDPMHVEAAAFAWLAHQTINCLPGSLASVTGASRDSILGGIYFPN